MFILAVVSHHTWNCMDYRNYRYLTWVILYVHIYAVVHRCRKKGEGVGKYKFDPTSGLVEAAFVCLNLCFCLLLNMPLYCHNIDKPDRKKWRQLLIGWISIDRQSGNWENFPTIFRIDLMQFLKERGQRYRYTVYIAFSLKTETWF